MGVTPDTPATPKKYIILYKKIKHTNFIKKYKMCKCVVCFFIIIYILYVSKKGGSWVAVSRNRC